MIAFKESYFMNIGLTQRIEIDNKTGESRDSLDQRWSVFLNFLGS